MPQSLPQPPSLRAAPAAKKGGSLPSCPFPLDAARAGRASSRSSTRRQMAIEIDKMSDVSKPPPEKMPQTPPMTLPDILDRPRARTPERTTNSPAIHRFRHRFLETSFVRLTGLHPASSNGAKPTSRSCRSSGPGPPSTVGRFLQFAINRSRFPVGLRRTSP